MRPRFLTHGGKHMIRIVYVPLDNRPYHTTWMEKMSQRLSFDLVMYEKNKLGSLHQKACQKDLLRFLLEEGKTADYIILSMDALLSGGLVQSRLGQFDLSEAYQVLDQLKAFKEQYPKVVLYVFDTLMRTTVTTYGYESNHLWRQINLYSRLQGALYLKPDPALEAELSELIREIHPKDLITFLTARNKKHQINRQLIELTKLGMVDYLTILQEDCMENGLQKPEQDALMALIQSFGVSHKVRLYNGTDEGALVLLAKIACEVYKQTPTIHIHQRGRHGLDVVMPYEDRTLKTNLEALLCVIGIKETTKEQASGILSIYTEAEDKTHIEKTSNYYRRPNKDQSYLDYVESINECIKSKPTVLVDQLFPNGGSSVLLKDIDYLGLSGYHAWNTASNALGSALCEWVVVCLTKTKDLNFVKERIIDDAIYQSEVRQAIDEQYALKRINVFDLKEHAAEAKEKIGALLSEKVKVFFDDTFEFDLPWNRTFEIEVRMK